MKEEISTWEMPDGEKIRVALYHPDDSADPAKCAVQIIHGFGEHIGQYQGFVSRLVDMGCICVIHDQRGFGEYAAQSRKLQGVTDSYENWINDVRTLGRRIKSSFPALPLVLFGHSMGGNIALNVLLRYEDAGSFYSRAIIESPWLRLAEPPAKIVTAAAGVLGRISAKLAVPTGLKMQYVVHDQDLVAQLVNDGAFHTRLSIRLYSQIVAAGEFVIENADSLNVPTLLLGAEEDHIVSIKAIRGFAATAELLSGKLIYREISHGYHALHADNVQEQFYNKIEVFLSTNPNEMPFSHLL